jgi:hypothetical protein
MAQLAIHQRLTVWGTQLVQLCTFVFWLHVRFLLLLATAFAWYSAFGARKKLLSEMRDSGGWPRALIGPTLDEPQKESPARSYRNLLRRDEWIRTARRWVTRGRWLLFYSRAGPQLVTNLMLYASGAVFLVVFLITF